MPISKLMQWRKPKQLELEEYLLKLKGKGLNPDGSMVIDPTPIAPPIGYKKAPSMVEIVRDMVRSERLAAAAREAGAETFEEADDFDIPDDPVDPRSGWENDYDPPVAEMIRAGKEALAAKKAAAGKVGGAGGTPPAAGGDKPPETP